MPAAAAPSVLALLVEPAVTVDVDDVRLKQGRADREVGDVFWFLRMWEFRARASKTPDSVSSLPSRGSGGSKAQPKKLVQVLYLVLGA